MRFDYLLGLMLEAVAILIVAKLARDRMLKWRGHDVNDLVARKRSLGAATTQAGYLIGVSLGFLGAIPVGHELTGFLAIAGTVALAGAVAIALQLAADQLSDRLIFRGVEDAKRSDEDVNLSLAVGKAAVSLATGLVLRGAMFDLEMSLLGRIAWFVAAQAVMVLSVLFYCRLTPYDDLGEIKRNNLAAAFPIVGILLAVGLVTEAAIAGKPTGSIAESAAGIGKFLGVSLLLIYLFRLITDFIMLPKVKLSAAIVQEKNVAAGVQEGVSFVLASLIVTFFLR